MLLATDLDGTFLGGKMQDRLELYRMIRQNPKIKLVFVTGRGIETVIPLLNNPIIPTPDYVISDVGSTIVNGHTLENVEPLQSQIEAKWPHIYGLEAQILKIEGISKQEVPQQRRSSYYYTVDSDLTAIHAIAQENDLDLITSVDKYLDLMPQGVNKGSSLQALISYLNEDPEDVLVAGDTLNDLSLFQAGFKGVAVSRSEQKLIDAVQGIPDILQAEREGAGGILEAMENFEIFRKFVQTTPQKRKKSPKSQREQLVIVYHRLPFEKKAVNGKPVRIAPKSPNGIIPSLLGLFENKRTGIWIGEEVKEKNGTPVPNQLIDEEKYPNLVAATIALSKGDIDRFYRVFSKEAFWPTIFSFVDKAKFNHEDWQHYLEINKIFAERVAEEADEGALVWIHEYNLWMVPAFLKAMRPDVKIGFFHHTSFPAADIFNIIPWRREIIGSLLLCDFISFHIPRYVENFVDVLRSHTPFKVLKKINSAKQFLTYSCALGVEQMTKVIEVEGRQIRLGAQPVGVNVENIERMLSQPKLKKRISTAIEQKEKSGRKFILSVERLDYVKGPLEKVKAFGEFLAEYPEYRGKVELINICTPPSQGMKIYNQIMQDLNQAVGEINGKYSTMDWTPIRYFYRALPFEEVVYYYGISDVAWITPLRDGLNLVAKEYVAVQGLSGQKKKGALVISEFAGCSVELQYALLTNPYDEKSMKESLLKALIMDDEEKEVRMSRLFEIVRHYDLNYWGRDFVSELEKA